MSMIAKYFRQKVGLSSVSKHSYKWSRVKGRLDLECPVYMRGFRDLINGHAWIVDGYMLQKRYDTRPGYGSISQSRTLLHVNWGWASGLFDGYYTEGVFDPSSRALETDAEVGDSGNPNTAFSEYTKRLKTLTWRKP